MFLMMSYKNTNQLIIRNEYIAINNIIIALDTTYSYKRARKLLKCQINSHNNVRRAIVIRLHLVLYLIMTVKPQITVCIKSHKVLCFGGPESKKLVLARMS